MYVVVHFSILFIYFRTQDYISDIEHFNVEKNSKILKNEKMKYKIAFCKKLNYSQIIQKILVTISDFL